MGWLGWPPHVARHTPIDEIELALEGRREVWRQTVQGYAEAERKARQEAGLETDDERQGRLVDQFHSLINEAAKRDVAEFVFEDGSDPLAESKDQDRNADRRSGHDASD